MDYSAVADPSNVLMDEANQPAIIQAIPVVAYKGDDRNAGDPVIDVTTLYTGNVAEFAAGRGVGGQGAPDPQQFLPIAARTHEEAGRSVGEKGLRRSTQDAAAFVVNGRA